MRRAGWGLADQAVSSLTNFSLSVFVARNLGPTEFGALTTVFTAYVAALGICRAITSEPLLVHYSAPEHPSWSAGTSRATGTALLVGVGLGVCCVLLGAVAPAPLRMPFLILGLTLPGLLIQDCWRFSFFARGRGFSAFANDLVWAIVLSAFLWALLARGQKPVTWLILLGWGGAATVAAFFGIRQAGIIPAPQKVLSWVRAEGSLIPRFLGEFAAVSGAGQLTVYAMGAVAGLAVLGSFRAAISILFGPIQVLIMGASAVAIPELVRASQISTTRLRWSSRLVALALAGAALAWGMVVLWIPSRVGVALLGPTWYQAHLLTTAVIVCWVTSGLMVGATAGLRALAAAKRSLGARVIGSLLTVAGGVGGVLVDGARGAAWGCALAGTLEAMLWWWQFTRAIGERDAAASPAPADAARRPPSRVPSGAFSQP